jgi:hypothetical protein
LIEAKEACRTDVQPSTKSWTDSNSLRVAALKAPMSLLVKAEVKAQHAILFCAAVDGIHQDADDVVAAKVAHAKSRAPLAWVELLDRAADDHGSGAGPRPGAA